MPSTSFPLNPELTAIAIGYINSDVQLIADKVLPRVLTPKRFSYQRYTTADAYTIPTTTVGRKSNPTVVEFGGTLVTDECIDFGLDDILPNDEIAAWEAMPKPPGAVSPLIKSTQLLTSLIMTDRERRVANLVTTLATYPSANRVTLSGTSQWSDFANSNPLDAMLTALDVPIERPNTIVMGMQVWTKLRQHPRVIQAANASAQTGGAITKQELADLLEVANVYVGTGTINTAAMGASPVYSKVWGKHCALLYIAPDASSINLPTFGFTAQFGSRVAGVFDEPKAGIRGSTRIRVGESVKEVISASDAAYFFQNAVA